MQLSFFDQKSQSDVTINDCLNWLRNEKFDIRQRENELDEFYQIRILMTAYAFHLEYSSPKWISIEEWVDICPKGPRIRLPRDKRKLSPHSCHYLEMKDITPEDWNIPRYVKTKQAHKLPRRATYIARPGDVFLSRFKEPLGKSVVYLGDPNPLYVNSNFILLRPKEGIQPKLVLAILKSAFLAFQLHKIIQRHMLIAEMYQYQVPNIMVPNLHETLREIIADYGEQRIGLEEILREDEGNENVKTKLNLIEYQINNELKSFIDET